ncbi:MAG: hypothetical protein A3G81_30585 [Betaproteobacteria bacterium RIFCSPLOWO2_12_FULL_65_14]|nr:MAG: hypothetical protein A3G81_30585 [Betaproteobacteria bacterium RIFCSPLOWO2_12_FULL_65_14]
MRSRNLFAVRVAMGRAAQIEPDEHDDLAPPVLHLDLEQIDPAPAQVKQEMLSLIGGLKRQGQRLPAHGKVASILVDAMLLHGDQRI